MRILLLLSATTLASALSSAALVFFTPTNAAWRMLKGVAEASSPDVTAWRLGGFDDSAWTNVPAPFYYSTAPVEPPFFNGGTFTGTLLDDMQFSYSCVFFCTIFVFLNAVRNAHLSLDLASDDGFIAWINGIEVARQNFPAGSVPFNGFALLAVVEPVPLATY